MAAISRRRFATTATGVVAAPFVRSPRAGAADAPRLKISELYAVGGDFSEKAKRLEGERVEMPGYMAPPLKPEVDFYVQTKMPMAVCPFCEDEAEWPSDIVFVRMRRRYDWVRFNRLIITEGVFELGTAVDDETGFVSRVRLTDAFYRVV